MYINNDFNTPRKRLFILRKVFSYTQKEMASVCQMPTRSYQRLEYGEMVMSAETIYKFSQIFKIKPSYFFVGSKESDIKVSSTNSLDGSSHDILDSLKITDMLSDNLNKVPSSTSNYTTTHLNKKLQKYLSVSTDSYKHRQEFQNLETACLNFYQLARVRNVLFISDTKLYLGGNQARRTLCISRVQNPNLDHLSFASVHHDISEVDGDYTFNISKLGANIQTETGMKVMVLDSLQ